MIFATVLTTLDYVIFFGGMALVMVIGLLVGRKEETSDDYFLAGRNSRWWGVAGSVFGSNVSANHVVGMMGVGYAFGFAQSHFEITAIAGLLVLTFVALPVYRKLGITTLSEYLGRRYNDGARLLYAMIMVIIMVVIMMVPGFYIGSRSINILIQGHPGDVSILHFQIGVLLMALVTASYTIFGGMKAVIATDVIQSVLVLIAGIGVAVITFGQPEVGGWAGMVAQDRAIDRPDQLLHLYNPINHPKLPWTGVLSGMLVLHFYYWGANQFIVQRALSARSESEARKGIIAAGFLKLLIPFFSIGTGIAAFYLFQKRGIQADQDAVFTTLLTELIAPLGFGIVGLVAAGLIGAILSSLDSMMNSTSAIVTHDVYKRFINPDATNRQLIFVGRVTIAVAVILAAGLAIFTMNPNSDKSFFLHIATHQSRFAAGLAAAFFLGLFWKRATPAGGVAAIVVGVLASYTLPGIYAATLGSETALLGPSLNFLHGMFISFLLSCLALVVVSLPGRPGGNGERLVWTQVMESDGAALRRGVKQLGLAALVFAILGAMVVYGGLAPGIAGVIGGGVAWTLFAWKRIESSWIRSDHFWGGALAGAAVFMMFYFF